MNTKIMISIFVTVVLSCFNVAEAQQAIFLVRHGETVAPKGTDLRPLSEAGQRRAVLLATPAKGCGYQRNLYERP